MAARRPDRSGTIRGAQLFKFRQRPRPPRTGVELWRPLRSSEVQKNRFGVVMIDRVGEMAHAPSEQEPEIMQNTNHNNDRGNTCDSMQKVRVRRWRTLLPQKLLAVPKVFFLCSFVIIALSSPAVSGFNVDVGSRVVHSGPRRSCDRECMFGFAVAQHRERGVPW